MCGATSGCCGNCALRKSPIILCDCRVPQRYYSTITTLSAKPYAVSDLTLTFWNYLQITLIIVSTTVQHSALPAEYTTSLYLVVTKCKRKASTSASIWAYNNPHLLNSSMSRSLASVCICSSWLIPACNLILWSCSKIYDLGYAPLTPWCAFHNSGFRIAVRGVELSLPPPSPPIIGGISVLNDEMTIYCSFVFLTFAAWNFYLWGSNVDTVTPVINCI